MTVYKVVRCIVPYGVSYRTVYRAVRWIVLLFTTYTGANMDSETNKGKSCFVHNDNKFCEYYRKKNVRVLSMYCEDLRVLLMDGTFKSCPRFFTQLYTVFGYANDTYMPLVYAVLSNKDQLTCEFLFGRIMDQD